jgi:hypothetical protein
MGFCTRYPILLLTAALAGTPGARGFETSAELGVLGLTDDDGEAIIAFMKAPSDRWSPPGD